MGRTYRVAGRKPGRPTNLARAAFGERLRTLMEERGLSVEETARRIKARLPKERLSSSDVEQFRQGQAWPRKRLFVALSVALGVEPHELLGQPAVGQQSTPAREPPHPGSEAKPPGKLLLEDRGETVRLHVEMAMSWEMALRILELVCVERQEEAPSGPASRS